MLSRRALCVLLATASCGGGRVAIGPTLPPAEAPPPVEPAAERATAPPPKKLTNEPVVPRGAAATRVAELAKVAAGVAAAFSSENGELTPDGKTLLFLSSRDGVSTLYAADAADPAAPARRLVERKERISMFAPTRDGKAVVFRSDRGADELWSLFRVPLEGGEPVELTPDAPLVRDHVFEPEGAPAKLYYSARKKEEQATVVHELPIAGGEPRVVYTTPSLALLLDASRNGKRLALVRVVSASESYVDVVDVASGKARQVYPSKGAAKVSVSNARFSADGARVFVATDGGGEKPQLLAIDAATGAVAARRTEESGAWSTRSLCQLSKKGDRLACPLSVGERDEVRVVDSRTLRPALTVQLPPGTGGPSSFAPDGSKLYVTWSTPSTPIDLYAVDLKGGAVTPARKDERPGLEGMPALDVNVAEIPAHDGVGLRANVYLPPAAKQGQKLPVIVSFHGGPANLSALRWSPFIRFLTAQGYAFVEPNVRGSSGFGRKYEMADDGPKRLESFKDVETVARWVGEQPWADRERLVIWGQSYGGYLVLIGLTRMPDLWRAGVDLYGVSDWVSVLQSTTGLIREVFRVEMGDLEKDRDFLESISPLRDVAKIVDPLFVYAGANDPRVPRTESDQIVRALRERGVAVEYMVAGNEGHSLARRENLVVFMARAARFLETALK